MVLEREKLSQKILLSHEMEVVGVLWNAEDKPLIVRESKRQQGDPG